MRGWRGCRDDQPEGFTSSSLDLTPTYHTTTTGNPGLIPAVQAAILNRSGLDTELSTSGGTSDGRFIAPRNVEVVELGPCNATIHKVNEQVSVKDLEALSVIYEDILGTLLSQ